MREISIKDNLAIVRQQLSLAAIKSGRSPEEIKLIAVSKKKPAAMINEATFANHTTFGENMVQEAIKKMYVLKNIENIDEEKKIEKDKKQSWADEKYVSYGEVQKVKSELLEEVNKNFSEDKKNIITEIINEWADLRIKVFEDKSFFS